MPDIGKARWEKQLEETKIIVAVCQKKQKEIEDALEEKRKKPSTLNDSANEQLRNYYFQLKNNEAALKHDKQELLTALQNSTITYLERALNENSAYASTELKEDVVKKFNEEYSSLAVLKTGQLQGNSKLEFIDYDIKKASLEEMIALANNILNKITTHSNQWIGYAYPFYIISTHLELFTNNKNSVFIFDKKNSALQQNAKKLSSLFMDRFTLDIEKIRHKENWNSLEEQKFINSAETTLADDYARLTYAKAAMANEKTLINEAANIDYKAKESLNRILDLSQELSKKRAKITSTANARKYDAAHIKEAAQLNDEVKLKASAYEDQHAQFLTQIQDPTTSYNDAVSRKDKLHMLLRRTVKDLTKQQDAASFCADFEETNLHLVTCDILTSERQNIITNKYINLNDFSEAIAKASGLVNTARQDWANAMSHRKENKLDSANTELQSAVIKSREAVPLVKKLYRMAVVRGYEKTHCEANESCLKLEKECKKISPQITQITENASELGINLSKLQLLNGDLTEQTAIVKQKAQEISNSYKEINENTTLQNINNSIAFANCKNDAPAHQQRKLKHNFKHTR